MNTPIASIPAGGTAASIPITLTIDEDFQGTEIVNVSEITFGTSVDDSGVNTQDIDSTPDDNNDDIIGGNNVVDNSGGDEDDHDFEQVAAVSYTHLTLPTIYSV